MRVSAVRLAALSLVTVASTAVAPVAAAQSVDEIVAKHIEARGGYDKIKAIQTIKMTRTVATPFSSVAVVVYKKRPALLRIDQTPKGQAAAIPRGISSEGVWDIAQGKPAMRPDKVATEAREFDGDFDGLLVDWKQKGHTVTLDGKETIAGSEAYKLKVATKGGSERFVYIDTKSFMETGQAGRWLIPQIDPKTKEFRHNDSVWVFSDFRDVNGVKFPFSVDEERTQYAPVPITTSQATYTEKIEVNVPMEDGLFVPPAAAK